MKMVKYCKARHAVKSRGETLIAVIHSNVRTVQSGSRQRLGRLKRLQGLNLSCWEKLDRTFLNACSSLIVITYYICIIYEIIVFLYKVKIILILISISYRNRCTLKAIIFVSL